jgi:hypothetical protein
LTLPVSRRSLRMRRLLAREAGRPFAVWRETATKIPY